MFPVIRKTGLCLALTWLICLALPAAASEREREIERLGHEFALTFQAGDITAFAPLATESPVGNPRWIYVTSILNSHQCIELVGEHATVLRADDATAFVVVDIAGTARYIFAPDKTGYWELQWTLHLRNGAKGWRIEGASTASKELAIAFLAGEKEWSEVRAAEDYVHPRALSYDFASKASGGGASPRRFAAIDHAETIAREFHDEAMLALCDFSRARLAWADKDFDRAAQLGEAAVARARTAGDPDTLGSALFGLAMSEAREHPDRAVADYTEALDMIEQFGNPRIGIASAINITDIRSNQRDYRGATVMAQRVLELSEKYRWRVGSSSALSYLGEIHDHLRDFAVAHQYYERALEAAKSAGDAGSIMQALQGVGGDEFELGELSASLEHLREALKYGSHSPSGTVASAYHAYTAVLIRLHRYDEAEKLLKETLRIAHEQREGAMVGIAYTDLSTIRLRQGHYEEAARLARLALAQNVELDLADAVYSSPWPLHLALGRALRASGHTKEAIEALRAAVSDIEAERDELAGASISNFRFFADKSDAYHELIELLVREKQPAEAFAVAEQMRGRILVDSFAAKPAASALTAGERSREEALERRLSETNKSILAARGSNNPARLAELRNELDAARLDLDRFDEESGVVHAAVRTRETVAGSKATLPPGMTATAVVEYVVGNDSTIVFTLRQIGKQPRITARVLPVGRKALAARVEAFCHAVESRDLGYARAAGRLEATLLEPLMPALHGVSTLAIVPDAELWRLPFQALMTPDGRFLIQRFGVFYTPSLSMLREARAAGSNQPPQPTLLAFGNPVVSSAEGARLRDIGYDGDIRPLPDAEREVRAIAALYGDRSRVYVEDQASENAFKREAPQYDILHLATHGFLDDHSPMYSALLFAASPGDSTEDGLLETREILRMHLHARMAVLAACDTGRGAAGPGEGVIGISWAFLMAGCPTTVVTQWKASSAAASILMVDFHRHLRNGAGKAGALRLAEVAMLHDRAFRHPFYWASFVVVGAP